MVRQLLKIPFEAYIWLVALAVLAVIDPSHEHISICPLDALGFSFCPGCGLGRSISYLFAGDISASFESHPLGIFALVILLFRILQLIKNNYQSYGSNY